MSSQLTTITLTLASLQIAIYLTLILLCVVKFITICRSTIRLIHLFYGIVAIYILLELAIQIYQLVQILLGLAPEDNLNVLLSLNVFCMICDVFILLLFTLYWKEIQGSFIYRVTNQGVQNCIRKRFIIPIIWLLSYTAYFCYLCITDNIVTNDLKDTNQIILYIACQAVCQILLLGCCIWQSYHWCKLENTIQLLERVMPVSMNKTRFRSIFWATTVFNSLRILFITDLIIMAHNQNYYHLILAINCFTITASLPIAFYLFGIKISEPVEQSTLNNKLNKDEQSQRSKRSSSAHETQLSYHSKKSKN